MSGEKSAFLGMHGFLVFSYKIMFDGRMKESHHSTLGISPSSISFLGAISASLVDAWIPVFFAAWEISFCNFSNWACLTPGATGEKEGTHSIFHLSTEKSVNWAQNWSDSLQIQTQHFRWNQQDWVEDYYHKIPISHYLGSHPLGDLLEAALLMEFEALTRTLSLSERHTVVEVGRGFQVLPWLLLQLLAELFSFYSANVR